MAPQENNSRPVPPTLMHVALVCKDIDESLRFYRAGLGYTRVYEWSKSSHADHTCRHIYEGRALYIELGGGTYLELFPGGRDDVDSLAGPLQHLAVIVPSVDEAYANCLAAGGHAFSFDEWPGGPTSVVLNGEPETKARVAFVKGPSGELIELFELHTPVIAR
ncbi:VOC family protein [Streptomyces hygroscopicus]|uniref:VOC family protein n=1 Tax=Streptomyces hygroscopicus TaxID=1912 RepID=UPI00082D971A|nr:VOC family protein [Streptomyces hygroscopicus]GLV79341.1 hypothetical protein Shyhy02_73410 [Streptomyces hygroscopicus subsp. hygroscopicus]